MAESRLARLRHMAEAHMSPQNYITIEVGELTDLLEVVANVQEERAATKALERAAVEGESLNLDISAAMDRQNRLDAALAKLDELEADNG